MNINWNAVGVYPFKASPSNQATGYPSSPALKLFIPENEDSSGNQAGTTSPIIRITTVEREPIGADVKPAPTQILTAQFKIEHSLDGSTWAAVTGGEGRLQGGGAGWESPFACLFPYLRLFAFGTYLDPANLIATQVTAEAVGTTTAATAFNFQTVGNFLFSGATTLGRIVPGSCTLTIGSQITATDTGTGNVWAKTGGSKTLAGSPGSINYDTGAGAINVTVAFSSGTAATLTYQYNAYTETPRGVQCMFQIHVNRTIFLLNI